MENIIESIRIATQDSATDAAREEGIRACRAVLAALETKSGQPLATTPEVTPIQAVVAGLSNMSVEQLLDLAIARLKAVVPEPKTTAAKPSPAATQTLRIPMLPVPRGRA